MLSRQAVLILSVLSGAALEFIVHIVSGRREAWDSEIFWTAGVPAVLAVSFALGFFSAGRAWRWTAAVVPGQVLTMTILSGEIGSLWPLALIFSAVLSAPFVLAAFIGAAVRRRVSPRLT